MTQGVLANVPQAQRSYESQAVVLRMQGDICCTKLIYFFSGRGCALASLVTQHHGAHKLLLVCIAQVQSLHVTGGERMRIGCKETCTAPN